MPIAEYWVLTNMESDGRREPFTWNGAAAGAQINDPKTGEAFKRCHLCVVEAESAEEAIHGVRQALPGNVQGKSYGILKSSLTAI
jgi:hypothetical protein